MSTLFDTKTYVFNDLEKISRLACDMFDHKCVKQVLDGGVSFCLWTAGPALQYVLNSGVSFCLWTTGPGLQYVLNGHVSFCLWTAGPALQYVLNGHVSFCLWTAGPGLQYVLNGHVSFCLWTAGPGLHHAVRHHRSVFHAERRLRRQNTTCPVVFLACRWLLPLPSASSTRLRGKQTPFMTRGRPATLRRERTTNKGEDC